VIGDDEKRITVTDTNASRSNPRYPTQLLSWVVTEQKAHTSWAFCSRNYLQEDLENPNISSELPRYGRR
ncbi:MAG: hypothetical protein ACLFVS_06810, partial [Candidatus Acetothermia bacterium]